MPTNFTTGPTKCDRSRIIFGLALVLFVLALWIGCRQTPGGAESRTVGFAKIGALRSGVEEDLKIARARIFKSSDAVVKARLDSTQLQRPMNVELSFTDGKLTSVQYSLPGLTHDFSKNTPIGRFGYRRASDEDVAPPLKDHYLFLGPLGHIYIGSSGLRIQPKPAFGMFAIGGACLFAIVARRKKSGGMAAPPKIM